MRAEQLLIYCNDMIANKLREFRPVMSAVRKEHAEHCNELLNTQQIIDKITDCCI